MGNYSSVTDNELVLLARSGEKTAEEQLALRYSRLVKICSRPFFLVGGDGEDLIQEGMLGLISAIREYDPTVNTSFKTFAEVCVKRRIYSAIKMASRKKHEPLNEMVSLDDILSEESQPGSGRFRRTPEEQVIASESADEIIETYTRYLSNFESKILSLYLDGFSYTEIAASCGRPEKSVDNAVQRIRRKLVQTQPPADSLRVGGEPTSAKSAKADAK